MKCKIYSTLCLLIIPFSYAMPAESKHPSGIKTHVNNAIELFNRGDYIESKKILSALTKEYPQNALLWFNLGNADFMLGNFEEAINSYENVESLNSNLWLPSRLYTVKAYRKLGRYLDAAEILKSVSGTVLPPGLESEFNLEKDLVIQSLLKTGLNYYKDGVYGFSVTYFDAVLDLSANAKAEMMKGLALLKAGDSSGAKSSFKKILNYSKDVNLDDEFKNFAQHFVKEIDDGKWMLTRDYMLRLFYGMGFNSNAYRTGEENVTFSRVFLLVSLDSAYKFASRQFFSAFIYYSFLFEEIFELSDLRYMENILSIPLIYNKESFHFKANPIISYSFLENKTFILKSGSQFLIQYGGKHKIGSSYSYLRGFSLNNTYEYLKGNYHDCSLFGVYTGRNLILKPGVRLLVDDIGDLAERSTLLPLANISYGPTLFLNWMISEDWMLKIKNIFLIRKYDNASTPGDINRNDKQWQGDIRLSRILKKNTSAFLSFTTVVNRSSLGSQNVENKNYYQIIVFLGFSWDALE